MNISQDLSDLNSMKLLRFGYVLFSVAVADFGLAIASLVNYLSPSNAVWFIPIMFLSAVSGALMTMFWLLRLIWLFIAYKPELEPVSREKLNVTFSWLALLIVFEGVSYYVTH